ncbi:MAG: N-acetylmuramoyl-L-alanine amidase [candidate division KSB1 bacterium]|nr:N-acetylmuramoyl-L-alanine amidase [candidate division KSB1 bacterium]MDZ7284337.1 N-acetylmuramoyl-L-alanine amidase [candidate division KSB1 bacterium]MDZ7415544.1 N-acetylmuramoyl-L-alanine amidase [candidate division KSB1 bacterium]
MLISLWHVAEAPAQTLRLEVVYPREELTITARDSTFVFGNYQPPSAKIRINGVPARQYPNQTYMAMVPVKPGKFVFRAVAIDTLPASGSVDSAVVERRVYIPAYLATSPAAPLQFDTSYVYPKVDLAMRAGEVLGVAVKASPRCRATFSIAGVAQDLPMAEQRPRRQFDWGEAVFGRARPPNTPEVMGIYTGVYTLRDSDSLHNASIHFQLSNDQGDTITLTAPGRLSLWSDAIPEVASLTEELTIGRTGPGNGYLLFLPQEVKLRLTGREGGFYRARLTDDESVWVPVANCQLLPAGTLPPRTTVQVARTQSFADRTRVTIFMEERLPFRIEQRTQPQRLEVILFGATADTDWIRHDYGDPLIGEIRWSQDQDEKYRLSIALNQKQQWGYAVGYDGTNLVLDIKKTPKLAPPPHSPLHGLWICVDPGHGPDLGAIGPTGFCEKDATFLLAEELRAQLERRGARVILTRTVAEEGMTLAARRKFADVSNADLFISLHYNALPDGVNPFLNRGSSAFYYHPQSYELANKILRMLLQKLKLPNFGLFYDNLAVCRVTNMPAVLIEPAFLMHPEEEKLILSPRFREQTAAAIVAGMEAFVRAARE